ncbi:MAG: LacI family DNA-binding transcriptional regulator [Nocardioidaceae bacterium]|nr:LacI family DNA-binding transcriptional regulator [Nocardioidaceae bacterium]
MATIVDVARLAGVSVSTVSHVVNGTRNVSDETRERVVRAIAATNYRQDRVARALRRAQTDTLALLLSDAGNLVLDEMVLGVEQEARKHGMTVLVAHAGDDPELELAAVQAFCNQRVDGLVITPVAHSRPEVADLLAETRTPFVVIDRPTSLAVDQVSVENCEPMRTLVGHLVELGHRRIGFVSGGSRVSSLEERFDGYVAGVEEAGLSIEPALVVRKETAAATRRAVVQLLSGPNRPTAVLAANQMSAVYVLEACHQLHLDVPGDLSMAMFDTFPFAEIFQPQITSVAQPTMRIGREGVRLIRRRIKKPDAAPRSLRLEPTLVYRSSSAAPR